MLFIIKYFEWFLFKTSLILSKLSDLELSSIIIKLILINEFSFLSLLIDFVNENKHLNTYSILGSSKILFLFWYQISTLELVLNIIDKFLIFFVNFTSPKGRIIDLSLLDNFSSRLFSRVGE